MSKKVRTKVLEVKVSQSVINHLSKVVSDSKLRLCAAEGLVKELQSNPARAVRDSEREHFSEIIEVLHIIGFPGAKKTSCGFDLDFDELQKWLDN